MYVYAHFFSIGTPSCRFRRGDFVCVCVRVRSRGCRETASRRGTVRHRFRLIDLAFLQRHQRRPRCRIVRCPCRKFVTALKTAAAAVCGGVFFSTSAPSFLSAGVGIKWDSRLSCAVPASLITSTLTPVSLFVGGWPLKGH